MTQNPLKPRAQHHGQRRNKRVAPNGGKSRVKRNSDLRSRFERYLELARSAATSGDKIAAEGHYQHAEHCFRLMNAAKA